jgi:DNA-binding MarR family transcriptional regulator
MRDNTFSCYRVPMQDQEEWGKQESLSDSFRAVSRRLRIQSQKALAPWDVTPGQARALGVLSRHGPVRLGTLSEHLRIAPRSATEVADGLEARGLVERTADPSDRRAVLLRATPAGRRVRDEVNAARAADARALFGRLPAVDRATLARILRELAQ